MSRIAFVTTCKGRLHHLKESLPRMVEQRPDEIVVVDYGCPDGTGDWVEATYPGVRLVRVTDDAEFSASRARNIGVRATTAEWLCFIDADMRMQPGWLDWMRGNLHPRCFFVASEEDGVSDVEAAGTVVCTRQAFDAIGGYDEVFRGWGGEDTDFYKRLALQALGRAYYPRHFLDPIRHGEEERFRFNPLKHKGLAIVISELYVEAKALIMAVQRVDSDLPYDFRVSLMQEVRRIAVEWRADPQKPLPGLTVRVEGASWLPEPFRLSRNATLTLSVSRSDPAPPPA